MTPAGAPCGLRLLDVAPAKKPTCGVHPLRVPKKTTPCVSTPGVVFLDAFIGFGPERDPGRSDSRLYRENRCRQCGWSGPMVSLTIGVVSPRAPRGCREQRMWADDGVPLHRT